MISFEDITRSKSFQNKDGIPFITFGLQKALKNKPLDFFYDSEDAVNSFVATKVNILGEIIDIISISTSLITANGTTHICTGLTDYVTNLESGVYYYEVNGRYRSDYFYVDDEMIAGTPNQPRIYVSGLNFHDANNNIPWINKLGAPYILFGLPAFNNVYPPSFKYLSSSAVSLFNFIKIDTLGNIIEEISLSTSLILSDGISHTCTGQEAYDISYMFPSLGYFVVNGRYESDIIHIIETDNRGVGYDIIGTTLIVY